MQAILKHEVSKGPTVIALASVSLQKDKQERQHKLRKQLCCLIFLINQGLLLEDMHMREIRIN